VFAVDASTIPRPWAATSPGRQFHHIAKGGRAGGEPVIAGWAWQWLCQLDVEPDSWTGPQDMVRVGPGEDPRRHAVDQIIAHAGRLAAAGESRVPLYAHDGGYDEAALTYDLREHLDKIQILVRIRSDRALYRDPPPRRPGQPGRPRHHAKERFECKNPSTWGQPDAELTVEDPRYGTVSVKAWAGLHLQLSRRGRFAELEQLPIVKATIIRVEVERLPGRRRKLEGPLWLWHAGPGLPDLDLCWRAYLHRSTSSTPTGSPSKPSAGTAPRCAIPSSSTAGPGWWSPGSTNCA
jgi:DDE superfamily endonuclease